MAVTETGKNVGTDVLLRPMRGKVRGRDFTPTTINLQLV